MDARGLTPDELLSTTRAVRRRLDVTRPVERHVLDDCLRLAQQAPSARNAQDWHFVVVTERERRAELGELWRAGAKRFLGAVGRTVARAPGGSARLLASVQHLADHIDDVPVHVIPCIEGRTEGKPVRVQASRWGSIVPAAWSFMLAARSHGLGTCWTTFHLEREEDAARVLAIPYERVMQAALIPVAYTVGREFKPAKRKPLETMVHWERW
ncbi:MAG: nitroreductase family protein [Actinomycetota bacterium]|nr:nitroreductase family protein [Actinomycetota bacterium]